MDNTLTSQKEKGFFQRAAEFAFMLYMITLYIFVDRKDTVIISQVAFIVFTGLTGLVILQRQRIHIGKNIMIVYITFAWMFATYFWAQNQYVAWIKIKTMWQLFLLFFLTYNLFCEEKNAHDYLLKCLYIAGIALLGYSIYTYGLSDVINMMSGNKDLRLGEEISQENTFGMMNATTCMVAFYYLFYRKKYKLFHVIILVLAFVFAMASGSRKALLIVCIGILFMTYKMYGIRQVYKVVAIVLVLSVLFVSAMQLPIFETINYRMELLGETLSGRSRRISSANLRLEMITDGWRLFKERILVGFGINNYQIVSRFRTYAHNNFVELLVNLGLIGFLLYYMIYWNAVKILWKSKTDAGKALFCVFIVRIMMEVAMVTYSDKVHWIIFSFFLIKPVEPTNNKEEEIKYENIPKKNEESCTLS